MKKIEGGVCAPAGFTAGGVRCGIKENTDRLDLGLIMSERCASCAAVYTTNLVKGAPIAVTKEHIRDGKARAVIFNSGNANTCACGGIETAELMCRILAKEAGIKEEDVAVASTGVIGQRLSIAPIERSIPALLSDLGKDGSDRAARAVMTTDTVKKEIAVEFEIGGRTCRIGGIAKGSGMIHPNMATMLCFITSDADISPAMLKRALACDIDYTFNMISVDGDTSTNDMVIILSNGMAKNAPIENEGEDFDLFCASLREVTSYLARCMAKDGEGATKLIECAVSGAPDRECAVKIAKSVIGSNLLKCAVFGSDANWGRVLCAVGYSGADIDINKTDIFFRSAAGEICVCSGGMGVDFSEETAKKILDEDEITILIKLDQGSGEATAFGCDLTYDYVKINGSYRS